ncbi:MAG: prepilin-type N-terminal cleavage/methylation domain-containing protein [Rhodanobacter sp.]
MSARRIGRRGVAGRRSTSVTAGASGFTLIELMIAMLLGLIVIAGVVSVFLATQRSYRTNQALGDVQDGSRIAFELMAHDIRDASLTGCTNNGKIGNVLNNGPAAGGTTWWADWSKPSRTDLTHANGIRGYGAGTVVDPASSAKTVGTDSLVLLGTEDQGLTINADVDVTHFTTNASTTTSLQAGDIAVVCDPVQATIFQVTSVVANSVEHAAGGSNPGNCSQGLGTPTVCTATGVAYIYRPNTQIARLTAVGWYIGATPGVAGGSSLFRVSLANAAGVPTAPATEMVRNVTGLTLGYHEAPAVGFVAASLVNSWAAVDAVQVTLVVASADTNAGTDGHALSKSFTATTTLRNRVR